MGSIGGETSWRLVVQVRNDRGLDQGNSNGDRERWKNCGYILEVATTWLANLLDVRAKERDKLKNHYVVHLEVIQHCMSTVIGKEINFLKKKETKQGWLLNFWLE